MLTVSRGLRPAGSVRRLHMAGQAIGQAVVKTVTVQAPRERAFTVFTEGMSAWWPLDGYHIGAAPAVDAVIEPREGGRWFERGDDGAECQWGRVLAWEPPGRVVLAWQIGADWAFDALLMTEVEVRFADAGEGRTRVELEHRDLERYGDRAEEMRATFGGDGGWNGLLQRFAADACSPLR